MSREWCPICNVTRLRGGTCPRCQGSPVVRITTQALAASPMWQAGIAPSYQRPPADPAAATLRLPEGLPWGRCLDRAEQRVTSSAYWQRRDGRGGVPHSGYGATMRDEEVG